MVTTLPRAVAIASADDDRRSLSTIPARALTKRMEAKVREQAVAVTRRKAFIKNCTDDTRQPLIFHQKHRPLWHHFKVPVYPARRPK
jgi:hypothetical protein